MTWKMTWKMTPVVGAVSVDTRGASAHRSWRARAVRRAAGPAPHGAARVRNQQATHIKGESTRP
jgi:hypothetical protein